MNQILSEDFQILSRWIYSYNGQILDMEKDYFILSRLEPIISDWGLKDFPDLIQNIKTNKYSPLASAVAEAMAVHESFFFRDQYPFQILSDEVIPKLLKRSIRCLKIWSAGCAKGQEPYSLAILLDKTPELRNWNVEIVASDFSNKIIQQARDGIYSNFEIQRGLKRDYLTEYFYSNGHSWQVKNYLRNKIEFKIINLLKDFSSLGVMDVIFCRNVLIYFDAETKNKIIKRLMNLLARDGYLFLGASETVVGLDIPLQSHGHGIYSRL